MKLADYYHHHHREVLDEETYKQMIAAIDPNFNFFNSPNSIRHGIRASWLKRVRFEDIEWDSAKLPSATANFWVLSGDHEWHTQIRFLNWTDYGSHTDMKPIERARMLLWDGDIQVHCMDDKGEICPAYLYWGMAYQCTQLGCAIYPEERPPHIRNPELKGIVCKHLDRTLKCLAFHSTDIAKYLKRDFG